MKKIKLSIGILAFVGLAVLNFTKSETTFVQKAMASSTDGSTTFSSNNNSSCCNFFNFGSCNQKRKTDSNVTVNCHITTTVYQSITGECRTEIIKFGTVICEVSAEFKAQAIVKSTNTEGFEFQSEVVTCPTNGDCNNCEEYRPKCEVS